MPVLTPFNPQSDYSSISSWLHLPAFQVQNCRRCLFFFIVCGYSRDRVHPRSWIEHVYLRGGLSHHRSGLEALICSHWCGVSNRPWAHSVTITQEIHLQGATGGPDLVPGIKVHMWCGLSVIRVFTTLGRFKTLVANEIKGKLLKSVVLDSFLNQSIL